MILKTHNQGHVLLVLGIDPGSHTTGWALLKSDGKKVTYINSGVLQFDKKENFLNRLTEIKIKRTAKRRMI